MKTFKKLPSGGFRRDNANGSVTFIPDDMDNADRIEIQRLIDAGEAEILDADPVVVNDTPTVEDRLRALETKARLR